MIFCWGL